MKKIFKVATLSLLSLMGGLSGSINANTFSQANSILKATSNTSTKLTLKGNDTVTVTDSYCAVYYDIETSTKSEIDMEDYFEVLSHFSYVWVDINFMLTDPDEPENPLFDVGPYDLGNYITKFQTAMDNTGIGQNDLASLHQVVPQFYPTMYTDSTKATTKTTDVYVPSLVMPYSDFASFWNKIDFSNAISGVNTIYVEAHGLRYFDGDDFLDFDYDFIDVYSGSNGEHSFSSAYYLNGYDSYTSNTLVNDINDNVKEFYASIEDDYVVPYRFDFTVYSMVGKTCTALEDTFLKKMPFYHADLDSQYHTFGTYHYGYAKEFKNFTTELDFKSLDTSIMTSCSNSSCEAHSTTFTLGGYKADVIMTQSSYLPKKNYSATINVDMDIDNPLTLEQIFANLKADGSLDDYPGATLSDRTLDLTIPGEHIAYFTFTKNGKAQYGSIVITVSDKVGPTITLKSSLSFDAFSEIDSSYFLNKITVTDNYDKDITLTAANLENHLYLDHKAWKDLINAKGKLVFSKDMVGKHVLTITYADSNGNTTSNDFVLKVVDPVAPVITRKDGQTGVIYMGLDRALKVTEEDLIDLFQAEDDVNGDVTSSLYMDDDLNLAKTGVHELEIHALDKSGNEGTLEFGVAVTEDLPDCILLSENDIEVFTGDPLTSDDIRKIIANGLYSGNDIDLEDIMINDNDYQENSTVEGTYVINYSLKMNGTGNSVEEAEGTLKLTVVKNENKDKTANVIALFFERLGNWFKGVFTKFDFTCFITNEEFEKKYPSEEKTTTKTSSSTKTSSVEEEESSNS